jgi:hypothetical protein
VGDSNGASCGVAARAVAHNPVIARTRMPRHAMFPPAVANLAGNIVPLSETILKAA